MTPAARLTTARCARAEVVARLEALTENLRLIDGKIDKYRGRVACGDADRLWSVPPGPADTGTPSASARARAHPISRA